MSDLFNLPPSLRIGVLRGGPSQEYDISLKTGGNVLAYLGETHKPIDIFISRDGTWHMQGIERSPERILKQLDVVFNALHGTYGEDGGVQELLDRHGARYTGSGRLSSAIAMNKSLTKDRAKKAGIKTPLYFVVRQEDSITEKAKLISSTLPYPLIIKPTCSGSSFGLYKANSYNELISALEAVLSEHGSALVEEFISGKEISCTALDNFRNQKTYIFPPAAVAPSDVLSRDETNAVEDITRKIHTALGLSHYSESDFIVSPKRGVYFLEVNTLPVLTADSLIPKSLESVGSNMHEFLHHIIGLALEGK